ncbi:hypothetical protein [Nocardioides sp.]|uniref:hypothetical protein n=1 Tax=Nocardioides sp. TaxID=35761 RepID=UPI00262401A9|nr:hypothetical protein [Nocardioides sp.]MDI6908898.1 hypothetical protein [Nocardioides sp.]
MSQQRPVAVSGAIWVLVAVVVTSGVTALLTLVFGDELDDAWAAGRTDLGSVEPPAFAPVAITMFVVVGVLVIVLLQFLQQGHNWARVLLSALVVLMAIATLASLRADPPMLFLALSVVGLSLDLTAAVLLWHPDTRAFTRSAPEGAGRS